MLQLTLDLVMGFIALLITTRILRKTQIKEISPFDFISALVLGELLGNAIYDEDVRIWNVLYALGIWTILMYAIEIITLKFRRSRKIIDGEPAIIIRKGKIDYNVLKKEKIDLNELLSLLRQKDVFSLREVEYGILEQSGELSVLRKYEYDNPTNKDMNLPSKSVYLPVSLILDGELLKKHLEVIGFDEEWLLKQLHRYGINKVEDVLYAEWKKDEGLYAVSKNATEKE